MEGCDGMPLYLVYSMLRNINTNYLTLSCLVDSEATSNAFSVNGSSSDAVDDLKKLIKVEKPVDFEHVDTTTSLSGASLTLSLQLTSTTPSF
jgi:hypothetical protein